MSETVTGLPREHFSSSQLTMWMRCPRQYAYRYVMGYKSPPSWALVGGRAVDQTLEWWLSNKMKGLEDKYVGDYAIKTFADIAGKEDVVDPKGDMTKTSNDVEGAVHAYIGSLGQTVRPVSLQEEVRPVISGTPFMGFIDLVEEAGEHRLVTDFKFVGRAPSHTAARDSMQLRIYDLAKDHVPEHEPRHVRLVSMVRTKKPKVEIRSHFVTDAERGALRAVTARVVHQIKARVYPMCNPSELLCSVRFCGYWDRCRGRDGEAETIEGEWTPEGGE